MKFPLVPHPEKKSLEVKISCAIEGFHLHYLLEGELNGTLIPLKSENPARKEGLYLHTCFEVFLLNPLGKYIEFNFSPSGDWAGFCFEGYRKKSVHMIESPQTTIHTSPNKVNIQVELPKDSIIHYLGGLPYRVGISAILEKLDGSLDYWALSHPATKPDFHDVKGFKEWPKT